MAKKHKSLALQMFFLFLPMCAFLISKSEIIITALFIALTAIMFFFTYAKNEYKLFIIGMIIGIIIELGGDIILKMQYWHNASLFGIPYWLPVFYGYSFVVIRRIGNIIVKSS